MDIMFQHSIKDAHHFRHALDLPEVGNMDNDLLIFRTDSLTEMIFVGALKTIQINKIRDHLYLLPDIEALIGFIAQIFGNRRHSVALVYREINHTFITRIAAYNRNIRAVQHNNNGHVIGLGTQNLLSQISTGGMWDGIVHM